MPLLKGQTLSIDERGIITLRRCEVKMGKTSAADLEIISGLFLSAAEQMRRTLVRTAFNAVIYEVLDFGISIADSKGRMVAEAGITLL